MNTRSSSSKRVVIINNLKSANIEQAIFILRGSEQSEEINVKLIAEAQQIIDNYVKRLENPKRESVYKIEQNRVVRTPKTKVKNKVSRLFIALISMAAVACAVYFANSIIALI